MAAISEIEFDILRVGEAMDLHPTPESLSVIHYLYLICVVVAVIGMAAYLYEKGIICCVTPKVDTSGWTAWIGLSLQLWDFLSDILLSREMWARQNWTARLMGPQNQLLFIAAVGSTAFLVIPYILNLYVSCTIKRYIKSNEGAVTWCVML